MILKVLCHFPIELRFATQNICDASGNWVDKIANISPLDCAMGEGGYEPSGMSFTICGLYDFFIDMMSSNNRYIAGKSVEILTEKDDLLYEGTVEKWGFLGEDFQIYLSDLFNFEKNYPLSTITKNEFPGYVDGALGEVIPVLYGHHSAPKGAVRAWRAKIDGYLVAAHSCLEIEAVFSPEGNQIDQAVGWWHDNDGYCWVYFPAGLGTYDYINVNVKGKVDDSVYITDPIEQFIDLMSSYIELDSFSFYDVQEIMQKRRYVGNICLYKEISYREIFDRFQATFDCEFFVSQSNLLSISMLDFRNLSPQKHIKEKQITSPIETESDPLQCKNVVKYMYGFVPEDESFLHMPTYESSTIWPEGYEPLPLHYTGDQVTAFDVAQRYLIKNKNPKNTIIISLWLADFIGLERGQVVDVEPLNKLYGEKFQVRKFEVDFKENNVRVFLKDIASLSERLFILGDRNELPQFWTQAEGQQRNYAYSADRATGKFSNDEYGKVLY